MPLEARLFSVCGLLCGQTQKRKFELPKIVTNIKEKDRFSGKKRSFPGAAGRIRTADLILTKDALYLLSYSSIHAAHAALYSKRLSPICCNGDPERARTVDLQRDRLAF